MPTLDAIVDTEPDISVILTGGALILVYNSGIPVQVRNVVFCKTRSMHMYERSFDTVGSPILTDRIFRRPDRVFSPGVRNVLHPNI